MGSPPSSSEKIWDFLVHSLVERVIRSLQDSMEEAGLKHQRLTARGLQTLCKLIENDHNNLPLGFKFGRDEDNTEVLKILTPNMLRLGRINTRSPQTTHWCFRDGGESY